MEELNPEGMVCPDYWKLVTRKLKQEVERLTTENEGFRTVIIQALRFQSDHTDGLEASRSGSGSSSDVDQSKANPACHPNDHVLQEDQQKKLVIEFVHPLLNKDIMLHIARYLDYPVITRGDNDLYNTKEKDKQDNFKTLQNARLVCIKWNEVFALKIQKHSSLRVNFNERTMADFVTDISPTSPEGTTRVVFENIKIDDPRCLDSKIFRTWISEYGRNLQSIILGEIHSDSNITKCIDELQYSRSSLQKLLLHWCPNLKSLIILAPIVNHYTDHDFDKEDLNEKDGSNHGDLDKKALTKVVKLDQLQIGARNHCSEVQRQLDIETTIQCVFKSVFSVKCLRLQSYGAPSQLQNINNMSTEERSIWQNLEELDLQKHLMAPNYLMALTRLRFVGLNTLKIGYLTEFGDAAQNLISTLLQNILVIPALKELELNDRRTRLARKSVEISSLLKIPTLLNLKIYSLEQWTVTSMDFMLTLPELISLEILGPRLLTDVSIFPETLFRPEMELRTEPHMNLRELRINCWTKDKSIFQGIVQSFPNLELLRLVFIGADLGEFIGHFASFKKLEELDLLITENIRGEEEKKLQMDIISNLPLCKSLRKFRIRVIPLCGIEEHVKPEISLTLDTFVKGFMKLPVLEVVVLDGFKVAVEFPDEFVKMILDNKVPRMVMKHIEVENKEGFPVGSFVMGKYSRNKAASLDGAH